MRTLTRDELISLILRNSGHFVDYQTDGNYDDEYYAQVVYWFTTFGKEWSICFQNGDMNGERLGTACYNNDGANIGLSQLRNILKTRPEFAHLIDEDSYDSYYELDQFIYSFCEYIAKHDNVSLAFTTD